MKKIICAILSLTFILSSCIGLSGCSRTSNDFCKIEFVDYVELGEKSFERLDSRGQSCIVLTNQVQAYFIITFNKGRFSLYSSGISFQRTYTYDHTGTTPKFVSCSIVGRDLLSNDNDKVIYPGDRLLCSVIYYYIKDENLPTDERLLEYCPKERSAKCEFVITISGREEIDNQSRKWGEKKVLHTQNIFVD